MGGEQGGGELWGEMGTSVIEKNKKTKLCLHHCMPEWSKKRRKEELERAVSNVIV